jgi:hypothetical protein
MRGWNISAVEQSYGMKLGGFESTDTSNVKANLVELINDVHASKEMDKTGTRRDCTLEHENAVLET